MGISEDILAYKSYREDTDSTIQNELVEQSMLYRLINSTEPVIQSKVLVLENTTENPIDYSMGAFYYISITINSGTIEIQNAVVDSQMKTIEFPFTTRRWSNLLITVNPNSKITVVRGD